MIEHADLSQEMEYLQKVRADLKTLLKRWVTVLYNEDPEWNAEFLIAFSDAESDTESLLDAESDVVR